MSQLSLEEFANYQNRSHEEQIGLLKSLFNLPLKDLATLFISHNRGLSLQLRPITFLPIAHYIEEGGSFHALTQCQNLLYQEEKHFAQFKELWVVIDKWKGNFETSSLLETLQEVVQTTRLQPNLHALGPSTIDILSILEARSELAVSPLAIVDVARECVCHGVTQIDGGSHLLVHKLAAEQGLKVWIAHDTGYMARRTKNEEALLSRLQEELAYIQSNIISNNACAGWFPWISGSNSKLVKKHVVRSFLIKLILLGRILFPSISIRAPRSILTGNRLFQAVRLGANDLGYGAINDMTSRVLGVPLLEKVKTEILKNNKLYFRNNNISLDTSQRES